MKKRTDALSVGAILVAYLVLALAYNFVIPPFEGLDEAEHFGVVRYVVDTGRLPVQGDATLAAYHIRQEASQPPLYYLLAGPLLRLARIPTDDAVAYLTPNPYVTCGTESIRSNKATLRHDPFAEAFPWRGGLLALHILRGWSTVLQAFTVIGVYAIARRVFPDRPGTPVLAAALTAFNPQFLIVASGVNNDNIATPIITWAMYGIVLIVQGGTSGRRALALGVLVGLAALSKLTGLLLLPLAAVSYSLSRSKNVLRGLSNPPARSPVLSGVEGTQPCPEQSRRNTARSLPWDAVRNVAIIVGVALAVAGWWYVRNWQLYGDPAGLGPMLDIVGRRGPVQPGLLLAELGLVFRSYWGQFPCAFFASAGYYSAWAVITVLGLAGVLWGLRREDRSARVLASTLALWLTMVLAGWLRWNLTTPAPGGRLLFTAVGATSTLLAYGLLRLPDLANGRSASTCAYVGAVAMAGVGGLALLVWVRPLFAPPPLVDAGRISPSHPLQAQFGPDIGLLGYDLRVGNAAEALGPGRYVDVTLYWRALQQVPVDYTLALQLSALAPGDTRTLLNFNTWPGGGNLPPSAWPVGPVIVDRYRLPLPLDTGLTQAWQFQVVLYDAQRGERLRVTLDGRPRGQERLVDDALVLGVYRVMGTSAPTLPETARLAVPVVFDQAIALTHAEVEERAGGIRVRLLWQSLNPLLHDVTVFVHAYDASGALLETGDGPPLEGNFPTSLWKSGDQVLDGHTIALSGDLSLKDVQVKVGLYRPGDGARLVAEQGTVRLPDDAVELFSSP